MSEDFDIYADLEHNESEIEKESQELVALKARIKELEKHVEATEQEKTAITRRNEILLENVSSLMLTAKAEIKRKDTMINDLRRKCDNVVFGRNPHNDKSVNYATKFTQTFATHTLNVGVQTLPVECSEPFQSRDREREKLCKSQIVKERELIHDRDRSINREKCRDQERKRDRDRYRDSDREHDRDRYSERDRDRHSERYRKRSYDSTRLKVPKHNEGRTRNDEGSYGEKYTPVLRVNAADEFNKNNNRFSDNKRTCLETRGERTQKHKDSKNYGEVTNTDLNHVSKHMAQKNKGSKMRECVSDPTERRASKQTANECNPTVNVSVHSSELIDANRKGLGIQISTKFRQQNVVGACTSITHDRRANTVSRSKSIRTDIGEDNVKLSKSSKQSTKYGQNVDSSTAVIKNIVNIEGCIPGHQNYIPKAQDNQKDDNVGSNQSLIPHSTFPVDPIPKNSSKNFESGKSFPEDDRLNLNSEELDDSESTVIVKDVIIREKENDEPNSKKELDTFLSGNETVSGAISKPPAIRNEASCPSVEFSSADPPSVLVDIKHNEDETTDSKGFDSSSEAKNVQVNITNESGRKKDKRKISSRGKTTPKPAKNVSQNDASEESVRNELCQSRRTNDEVIRLARNSENEVQNADPCKLNTIRTRSSTACEGDASQMEKTQALPHSQTTINAEAARNDVANEPVHLSMLGNMERNSELPEVISVAKKLVSDVTISESKLLVTTATVPDAVNEKQQYPSPMKDAISSVDNNSHCFSLRDRRSNSCYSDVLEIGERPPPPTPELMSIQTYFMNFNVQEVENELIPGNEQSLPAHCAEATNISEAVTLNLAADLLEVEAANSMQTNAMNKVQKKPKTSTAEIVRERLRKKNSATVQKTSPHSSAISMSMIPVKRRLSIDSASIACKRNKLDTTSTLVPSVDRNKLSVSPSGKLSSTYFSEIALPITSALDSIPCKLRSPNIKQKGHEMRMTPMVVVHSPAKPSQEMGKHVQNNCYSLPSDDQSSLQHIMDSLLQTPIKNESCDNGSPPCANGLTGDEGKGKNIAAKNYENLEICSTPLSTKPLSRFSHDDGQGNAFFRKTTSITEEKRSLTTFDEPPKASFISSELGTGREVESSNTVDMGKAVQESPHEQTTQLVNKHSGGTIKSTATHIGRSKKRQSPKQMLNAPTAPDGSSCLKLNNYKTSSSKEKTKKTNVVLNAGKNRDDVTAILQQPNKTTNATDISIKVPQLIVFKAPASVPQSTHLQPQTTTYSANIIDTKKNENCILENVPSKIVHQQTAANVDADEKTGKRTVTQSSSNCIQEDESHFATPSLKNYQIANKTPIELNTNRLEMSRKRSRKQNNEGERRTEVTKMQRKIENNQAVVKTGTEILTDYENKQPVMGCNYSETEKVNPQHLESQSTVSVSDGNLSSLNPQSQTEPSVPANVLSTTNTCDKRTENAERSERVISNVTLNLSLADNSTNSRSIRKRDTPVQHIREMRIVKESPSLMRVFITRK